jgi:hypothetical protein
VQKKEDVDAIWWTEARDGAPGTKNGPAPNVTSAENGKPYFGAVVKCSDLLRI